MSDWLESYSAEWDIRLVDQETWADSESVDGIMSVSISRDATGDKPMIETGTMQSDGDAPFESAWCRIYMLATQGASERVPMATLLFERGRVTTHHRQPICELRGWSVLKPAADLKLKRGMFAASGIDCAALAGRLLRECIPAPVSVDGSFTFVDDMIFNIGESYLQAVWRILKAADWCMQIDGNGTVRIMQKPTEPSLELDKAHASLLIPGVDMTLDISDIPNRYIAIDEKGEFGVAENDDPNLPASYQRRGRWVECVDSSPTRVDGETLHGYAERRLRELSTVTRSYSYTREWWPECGPFSVVRASLPDYGISGDLRIMRQTLNCGKGVTVTETSGEEVRV